MWLPDTYWAALAVKNDETARASREIGYPDALLSGTPVPAEAATELVLCEVDASEWPGFERPAAPRVRLRRLFRAGRLPRNAGRRSAVAALAFLLAAACAPGGESPPPEPIGREGAAEGTDSPPAWRELVKQVREEEEPMLLRSHAPAVVRTSWDQLVITAKDGSRHPFVDEVVGEDLRWIHRFGGYLDQIDAYFIERRYVPEGGEFLLVEAGTGRTTRIDAPPVPSPDGRRFATASLDLVAGHAPNRIRVYRMEESGPVPEWQLEPREWGARHPTWLDERTLRMERGVVDWSTHGLRTSPMVLRREQGRWTMEPSHAHARDVLLAFLSALGEKQYIEATLYYGGSYEVLRTWNPELSPGDLPGLWRSACEHNGLQCLGRAEVVRAEEVSPTEVRFAVRLYTPSGALFVRGPCCGETEETMPPQSTFSFTVRRTGERYLVVDLPPYVP